MPHCWRCGKPKYCVTHDISCPGNPKYERYEKQLEYKNLIREENAINIPHNQHTISNSYNQQTISCIWHIAYCIKLIIMFYVLKFIFFPWTLFSYKYNVFNDIFNTNIMGTNIFSVSKYESIIFEFKIYMLICPLFIICSYLLLITYLRTT